MGNLISNSFSASCLKHTVQYKDIPRILRFLTMVVNCEESQYTNALSYTLSLTLLSKRKIKTSTLGNKGNIQKQKPDRPKVMEI